MAKREYKLMGNDGVFDTDAAIFMPTEQMVSVSDALFHEQTETHIHVFGPRRHGKTTMLSHLMREAKAAGHNVGYVDAGSSFRSLNNESDVLYHVYEQAIDSIDREELNIAYSNKMTSRFEEELDKINDLDAATDLLFVRLEELSQRFRKPITMLFDELGIMRDSPYYRTFISFCKKHKELGSESPIMIVTADLNPLPWLSRLQQGFANAVTHAQIRKLGMEFVPTLIQALPSGTLAEKEKLAAKIIEETGGYGGLIYSVIDAINHAVFTKAEESIETTIENSLSSIAHKSETSHQLGSETVYMEEIPVEHVHACMDVYSDLIVGPADKTIKTDFVTATHLALTGLASVANDNLTVGPVAPLIRRAFDSNWIGRQREKTVTLERRKTPHNMMWGPTHYKNL